MEKTLAMLDKILPFVIIFAGIALCISLLALGVYTWTYLHKRINLDKSKQLIEENRQIVEKAHVITTLESENEAIIELRKEKQLLKSANKDLIKANQDLKTENKVLEKK